MAYKKDDLIKQSLKVIKENEDVVFIDEVASLLPCSRKTFYNFKLHELHELKGNLDVNKLRLKNKLRAKWFKSDSATLQIALYKLIATDQEHDALATIKQNVKQDNPLTGIDIQIISNEPESKD